ncbi:putative M16 family peptidase [Neospora caninum Liverpool]|uniref:Putative M16 family peptidase n=1 Tax=Neospora caninum (strain Liverpool) TaxID=572307 RepID=F0V9C6_NEOCL|nr:putative M16 family peptidase [Neospora caninum Liverpool]CBZ50351.1 putative M16 family peptidase [Neospora caninum Liverpool]|eukprot:XP_003880385.1 putative M16 family peptidase [Neospora caninum Liverpool]
MSSSLSSLRSSLSSPLLPAHPYAVNKELPNGLAYFLLPHAYPPGSLEVHMEVHAGSTSEGEHERGIAHLCEHISYMGSRTREALIRRQAETNAYTDFHHTVFFAAWRGGDKEEAGSPHQGRHEHLTSEEKLRLALTAMKEVLEAPTQFTTERLNRERSAVISEASLVNTISYRKEQILLSLLHAETILPSRFPIGRLDQIRSWKVEDARRFHARCYRPDNAAIYVVGDIGRERAEKIVREVLGPSQSPPSSVSGSPSGCSSLFSSRELHVWQHPLIQQFSLVFLSKKPLQPLKTFADYKRLILRKLILQALSLRLSSATREKGAKIHQIDLCEVNSIKEGCRVLSLEVQSDQRGEEWKDAINTAIQQVRQMAHYGLSVSELRSLLGTYSVNLRRLRLSQLSSADMLRVVMETAACQHTLLHLEEEKLIAMQLLGLHGCDPTSSLASDLSQQSPSVSASPPSSLESSSRPDVASSSEVAATADERNPPPNDARSEAEDDAPSPGEGALLREINEEAKDLCRWIEILPDDAHSGPDVVLAFMHGPAASERPRTGQAGTHEAEEGNAGPLAGGHERQESAEGAPREASCSALVSQRYRTLNGKAREIRRHHPAGLEEETSGRQGGADAKAKESETDVREHSTREPHVARGDRAIAPIKKADIAAAITHAFHQEVEPPTADIQAPARLLSAEESAVLRQQATRVPAQGSDGSEAESADAASSEKPREDAMQPSDPATSFLRRSKLENEEEDDSAHAFLHNHSMRMTSLQNNIKFNAKFADDEKGTAHIRLLLPGGRMGAAVNPAVSSSSLQGRSVDHGAKDANDGDSEEAENRRRRLEARSRWGAALVLGARTMMEGGALGGFTRQQVESFCQKNLIGVSIDCLDEFFSIDISVPTNLGGDFPVTNGPEGGPLESAFHLLRLILSSFVYEEDAFDRARQQVLLDYEHYTKDLSAYSLGQLVIEMSGGDSRFLCLRPEVIKTLSFSDVKSVVRTLLRDQLKAGNMELNVVGDINLRDTEELAQVYLGTLQSLPLDEEDKPTKQVERCESAVAEDAGARQADYSVERARETERGLNQEEGKGLALERESEAEALRDPRRHPAFGRVALWLLQEIVSKRMFSVLREEQRLTYDATFDFLSFEILRGGLFVVTVHTEPRLVEAVLQAARMALRDLATIRPLQGYQLESAKKQIISRHAHDRQLARYWMELLAGVQLDDLPQKNLAYIRDLPAVVESVSLEDLQEIFESFGLRDADLWEGVGTSGPVPPGGFIGRNSGERKSLSVASTLRK